LNSSALLISVGFFCLWPLLVGFIGFQIGRRRLKLRSPILISRSPMESDDDYREPIEPAFRQGVLGRLKHKNDVGFGK
jgi:hypothetical protein